MNKSCALRLLESYVGFSSLLPQYGTAVLLRLGTHDIFLLYRDDKRLQTAFLQPNGIFSNEAFNISALDVLNAFVSYYQGKKVNEITTRCRNYLRIIGKLAIGTTEVCEKTQYGYRVLRKADGTPLPDHTICVMNDKLVSVSWGFAHKSWFVKELGQKVFNRA